MGLNTENAGAVVAGSPVGNGVTTHEVEVLIGTYVKSVGRDVKAGETVIVSNADYRFLKPYGYVKDAGADVEAEVATGGADTEDDNKTDGNTEGDKSKDEAPKGNAPKVEGKRK